MKTRLPSNDPQSDPRKTVDRSDLGFASVNALPQVASKSTLKDSLVLAGGIMGAVFLGALTLVFMNNNRQAAQTQPPQAQPVQPMPPQPGQNGTVVELPPVALPEGPPLSQPQPPQAGGAAPVADANNARANALIYDVSAPDPDPAVNASQSTAPAQKAEGNLMDANSVAALTSLDPTRQVRATRITTPSRTVSQGTLIPAVLETALNSDLPGYTRALVSRDVRSFDGSRVLIPRGSRLIGTYRSGLQSGQNRLFITWTRLIRPDGTAIVLTDPSTDNLGQAGQTGDVDTHFFKRFGSAMLLSIIGGLANSSSSGDRNTIVIGTAQGANNAATAALQADSKIGPTVRVAQGTPIQIFVSRDLDFSL